MFSASAPSDRPLPTGVLERVPAGQVESIVVMEVLKVPPGSCGRNTNIRENLIFDICNDINYAERGVHFCCTIQSNSTIITVTPVTGTLGITTT